LRRAERVWEIDKEGGNDYLKERLQSHATEIGFPEEPQQAGHPDEDQGVACFFVKREKAGAPDAR
jgi:hypothetical protein